MDAIETVLTQLIQSGLLNEQRFVEHYIHFRLNKGYGPLRIKMELQARGLTSEMIAEQLKITDNAWFDEILKVWQKHFKGKIAKEPKLRAKQIRFLQQRGFTREQIESVLEEI